MKFGLFVTIIFSTLVAELLSSVFVKLWGKVKPIVEAEKLKMAQDIIDQNNTENLESLQMPDSFKKYYQKMILKFSKNKAVK